MVSDKATNLCRKYKVGQKMLTASQLFELMCNVIENPKLNTLDQIKLVTREIKENEALCSFFGITDGDVNSLRAGVTYPYLINLFEQKVVSRFRNKTIDKAIFKRDYPYIHSSLSAVLCNTPDNDIIQFFRSVSRANMTGYLDKIAPFDTRRFFAKIGLTTRDVPLMTLESFEEWTILLYLVFDAHFTIKNENVFVRR